MGLHDFMISRQYRIFKAQPGVKRQPRSNEMTVQESVLSHDHLLWQTLGCIHIEIDAFGTTLSTSFDNCSMDDRG
jgi:hypothetical protein